MAIRDRNAGISAWVSMVEAYSGLIGALSQDIERKHGLPLTWLEVLIRLFEASELGLRMQDLAEQAWLSKSGVTRLVDRMEAEGLVARATCATDRRVTYATITPNGRETLDRVLPDHLAQIDRLFSDHLSHQELVAVSASMQKVIKALESTKPAKEQREEEASV